VELKKLNQSAIVVAAPAFGGCDRIRIMKEKPLKNRLLMLICVVCVMTTATQGGLFKNSVDLADLSEVSPDSLETLKDTEFAVFVAQVRVHTVKAAENRAAGGVKAANQIVEAENLDMKAAEAEQKAAKANQDEERTTAATARITGTKEDLETAKALRKWKAQEQEARQAEVAMAKSALDLAEATRDAARMRLLIREDVPSAKKYDLADLDREVAKRQKEYDSASRKARDKMARVDKLKADWNQLAKNVDFAATE